MNELTSTRSHPPLASRRHTARFILIVGGIALLGFVQTRGGAPLRNPARIPFYFSLAGFQLLFLWFVNKGIRPHGLSLFDLFGKRWQRAMDVVKDTALAIAFVLLLRAMSELFRHLSGPMVAKVVFLLPRDAIESLCWIALAIVAGVSEEVVYRGYLQPQLQSLTRSLPLAILLQAILFGVAHVYQGGAAAALTAVYGLAFGLLAAWRHSLIPGIMAHCLIDIIGGLQLG